MVFKNVFGLHLEMLQQIFIQATLVIFVIGSFFSENSTLLNIFKWVGVAYILYLAYDLYNSKAKNINSKILIQKVFFLFLEMVF